jgi:vacuolar-type H+-ATPase subunit E/Vma4
MGCRAPTPLPDTDVLSAVLRAVLCYAPTPHEHSAGGVVVTSADGRILCSNTLDHRIHIAYEANLPAIRSALFGNE